VSVSPVLCLPVLWATRYGGVGRMRVALGIPPEVRINWVGGLPPVPVKPSARRKYGR
jgi:hypothetical protein